MKTTNKATSLQTQIICVNMLHEHAKEFIKREADFLTPLIGQKVFKVSGEFLAKFEHERPAKKFKINAFGFDYWIDSHYYFVVAYDKLTMHVRTCASGGGRDQCGVNAHCNYQNTQIDLFNVIEDTILGEPCKSDSTHLDVVYDERTILEQAEKVKEQAKIYEQTLNRVPYIFRSTLYLNRLTH